jgi:hypothetical protein
VRIGAVSEALVEFKEVIHEPIAEFLDVSFLAFASGKFLPSGEQIFDRYDIFKTIMLPVIEHVLSVYKTWYAYRDNLPKKSRYTLGDKIDNRFLELLELLQLACYQNPADKTSTLARALTILDMLKFFIKVSWEIRIIDNAKYECLSKGLHDAGKQIGGWHKKTSTK